MNACNLPTQEGIKTLRLLPPEKPQLVTVNLKLKIHEKQSICLTTVF